MLVCNLPPPGVCAKARPSGSTSPPKPRFHNFSNPFCVRFPNPPAVKRKTCRARDGGWCDGWQLGAHRLETARFCEKRRYSSAKRMALLSPSVAATLRFIRSDSCGQPRRSLTVACRTMADGVTPCLRASLSPPLIPTMVGIGHKWLHLELVARGMRTDPAPQQPVRVCEERLLLLRRDFDVDDSPDEFPCSGRGGVWHQDRGREKAHRWLLQMSPLGPCQALYATWIAAPVSIFSHMNPAATPAPATATPQADQPPASCEGLPKHQHESFPKAP